MRVAANLTTLFAEAGHSLRSRCMAAKTAGFKAAEFHWQFGVSAVECRDALQDAGLQCVLLNCYPGEADSTTDFGFAAQPGREAEFLDSFRNTVEYARCIACPTIHVLSGYEVAGAAAAQERMLVDNLKSILPILEQNNITAVIEPINQVSKPRYFLCNYAVAARVLAAVGSPRVRLLLDVFHLQMITGNITNNIRTLLPLTGHVQVSQAPHRREPSSPGELNYSYVMDTFRDAGYNGWVGCEYTPAAGTATGTTLDWVDHCGLTF